MPVQLVHERLAEPHHFVVALALRIEVRASLAAPQGQRGQRVLEDLLEGEELQQAQVDGRMKTKPALVGTDGAVHLHPEAAVDPNLSLVVHPGNPEEHRPLRHDHALEDPGLAVLRLAVQNQPHGFRHFLHGLMKLGLCGAPRLDVRHQGVDVVGHRFAP
jgi:hypothetical protein